jgi:hypothetical protein
MSIKNKKSIQDLTTFVTIFGTTAFFAVKIITLDRYLLAVVFFLLSCILVAWMYRDVLTKIDKEHIARFAFSIPIVILFHLLIYCIISAYIDKPNWSFDSSGTSWLLVDKYFAFAIPLNVLMQQLLITGLTLRLVKEKVSLFNTTIFFVIGFGLAHIFQLFRLDMFIGVLFTVGAMILGVIFPYTLYTKKDGFTINYFIHLLVYDFAALASHLLF